MLIIKKFLHHSNHSPTLHVLIHFAVNTFQILSKFSNYFITPVDTNFANFFFAHIFCTNNNKTRLSQRSNATIIKRCATITAASVIYFYFSINNWSNYEPWRFCCGVNIKMNFFFGFTSGNFSVRCKEKPFFLCVRL